MPSNRVAVLSRRDIETAAGKLQWNRQLPKWTVRVDGRQLPARPLVLEAAGVPPNDPTNSHQAVALLQDRGFEVFYQGRPLQSPGVPSASFITDAYIESLRGSCKGEDSLVDAREHEHRLEK